MDIQPAHSDKPVFDKTTSEKENEHGVSSGKAALLSTQRQTFLLCRKVGKNMVVNPSPFAQ
jgi:hypothetical protein